MDPLEAMRLHFALAFGAMAIQRKLVGACWQAMLWSMPHAALPGAGSKGRPAGRRKGRG